VNLLATPTWLRLTLAVFLMLALALGGMIAWETKVSRETSIEQAVDFANSIHEMTMAGLTGMMITGTVGQINGAMGQLSRATQQNASASEELAATAAELGEQAVDLQQTMTFFHLAGDGRKGRAV
jgi:hypothetical protein